MSYGGEFEQGPMEQQPSIPSWKNGLFDCYGDVTICLMSYLVPCFVFGLLAEALGKNCVLYTLLSFLPLINWYFCTEVRTEIRRKAKIPGTILDDFIIQNVCTPCALAQEGQEVKIEGQRLLRQ